MQRPDYLDLVALEGGKADSIVAAIKSVLLRKDPTVDTPERRHSGDDRYGDYCSI